MPASSRSTPAPAFACADFGSNGEIRIETGTALEWPGEFQLTSAPVSVAASSSSARRLRIIAASTRRPARYAPSMRGPDGGAGASTR